MDDAPDSAPTRPETPVAIRGVGPLEELQALAEQLHQDQGPAAVAELLERARELLWGE